MSVSAASAAFDRELFPSFSFPSQESPVGATSAQVFGGEVDTTSEASDLLPQFTFDRYVVGPSNELAFRASRAVAEAPGEVYSPLYIYGPSSLGKTHLLQAIGHEVRRARPGLNVVYATTERFLNEFLTCVRHHRMKEFRQKYRQADVLLLDDIHILKGKAQVQEEFLNTFNHLHQAKKQVVFVSDVLPTALDDLEPRLKTRFEWGLIVDVQYPDLATRLAIFRMKAQELGLVLSDEILDFVADVSKGDIRRLEGLAKRLKAFADIGGGQLTLERARQALGVLTERVGRMPLVDDIVNAVAKHFTVSASEIRSSKRQRAVVIPRQVAMFLCRQMTREGLTSIAEKFGGRDHTTVVHAVKKIETSLTTDGELKAAVEAIRRRIEFH